MLQLSQIDWMSLISYIKIIVLYGIQGPELFHPVRSNTSYRLWNPATTSFLQRDSNNIFCNGSLKDMDYASKYITDQKSILY